MTVPSKTWTAITDGTIDADSPLDETLMTALRDNLVHLEEWLGDGYTAAKDHDHDGVNSAPFTFALIDPDTFYGLVVKTYALGDSLYHSNDAETETASTSYVKVKEITLGSFVGSGSDFRIKFSLFATINKTAWGKVYINGSAVGTERSQFSNSWAEFSEDFTNLNPGDLIQIYIKGESGNIARTRNFRLYIEPIDSTVFTFNS